MGRLLLVFLLLPVLSFSHPGTGIVEDSKGNIYYTDLSRVLRIDARGNITIVINSVHTHELYMDAQDNLFGEHLWYNSGDESWNYYVWKRDPTGRTTKVIPDKKGFREDFGFARDNAGRMYLADRSSTCQKISRVTSGGREAIGDKCLHNIRHIQSTASGKILFVDFQDVCQISANGHIETLAVKVANPAWTTSNTNNQNSVFGVWDDPQGNLYVAVYSDRSVKRFSRSGQELSRISISSPWAPSGGLVDRQGRVWLLEADEANRVRVELVAGSERKLFAY